MFRKQQRFDNETQGKIDSLYRFVLRSIEDGEWELFHNSYYPYWRHLPTGMVIVGYRNGAERRTAWQPYDEANNTTHDNPFSKEQCKYIGQAMNRMWTDKQQREEHANLAKFVAATHNTIRGLPAEPHPEQIEQAASEVKEWIEPK